MEEILTKSDHKKHCIACPNGYLWLGKSTDDLCEITNLKRFICLPCYQRLKDNERDIVEHPKGLELNIVFKDK